MDGVLGASALGAGAVWLPGCGASPHARTMADAEALDLVSRLDRGIESVRSSPFATVAQPWTMRDAASERILRLGLESLVVADVARSIEPGTYIPESLATRLNEALPVLDDCAVTYHALLESTPPAVRRALDARFRDEPDIAMTVTEAIDQRAADIGISPASRMRLRSVASNVGTRVRRQSTSALLDDCVRKIEVAVGQGGADVRLARGPAAMAMIEAIWQQVDGVPPSGGTGTSPWGSSQAVTVPPGYASSGTGYASTTGGVVVVAPQATDSELVLPEPQRGNPGDTELTVGGVMAGAGLVVFGIAALASALTGNFGLISPIVIAATPAGVAVVIGIILLIIGGVQNARG